MTAITSQRGAPLAGEITVPGDKSVSHRALMLGGLAVGETRITGLLEAEDVLATARAMRGLGVIVERRADGDWTVFGRGVGGLAEPDDVLDMGNSGTGARLLMGILASHPFSATLTGDASLRGRPMRRVMTPLEKIGAAFTARDGGRMPLTIVGAAEPMPITYELPVASAQVKSAILLAGLNTPGITTVIEPKPTRDHSERMLAEFGAEVTTTELADGGRRISLRGEPELAGRRVTVPADISSAAFPLVAAVLVPGSRLTLTGIGVNPLRTGLLDSLAEMGAEIEIARRDDGRGEPIADITITAGALKGADIPAERAPSMIDEYPILAVAAACAEGTTRMTGLAELRVKESDRLAAMADGLAACGVRVEADADSLTVHGTGAPPPGGVEIAVNLDHRIAMAFMVLGMAADRPVTIDDGDPVDTSFPGFVAMMNGLGANLTEGKQ